MFSKAIRNVAERLCKLSKVKHNQRNMVAYKLFYYRNRHLYYDKTNHLYIFAKKKF